MSDFKVDKNAVPTRLFLADGSPLDGTMYLSPFSPAHTGPQTVEELMEESGRVLPFRTVEGRFVLVGKSSVAAAAVPASTGRPPGFWGAAPVAVQLSGHHRLHGSLLLEEGKGTRLSDAVNAPRPWLPLETPEHIVWLAKEHIVTLEAREG